MALKPNIYNGLEGRTTELQLATVVLRNGGVSATLTHLWLTIHWFFASTFVVKIATFAKLQNVSTHFKRTMTKEEIIAHSDRIIKDAQIHPHGGLTQAREFLRVIAGEESSFFLTLAQILSKATDAHKSNRVHEVLTSFSQFVQNDLLRSVSLEREIQIDTVSDYLEQAENLLNDKNVHPAAPAVIIGASLEEFLRNWLEEEGTDLTTIKNSLDSYSTELKRMEKITKQDVKDIASWGGTRNDAAHGHWENVAERNRIKLMLEGVNLFMRKYGME